MPRRCPPLLCSSLDLDAQPSVKRPEQTSEARETRKSTPREGGIAFSRFSAGRWRWGPLDSGPTPPGREPRPSARAPEESGRLRCGKAEGSQSRRYLSSPLASTPILV